MSSRLLERILEQAVYWFYMCIINSCFPFSKHSHKKQNDSLETRGWCFCLNLTLNLNSTWTLGWLYRAYIKTAKNVDFCEELLSENDFETVLITFFCYDHSAKASEAVQKIASDQKEYRKCSSCVWFSSAFLLSKMK